MSVYFSIYRNDTWAPEQTAKGDLEPNVCAATINMPANAPLGTWSFEIQQQGAGDFRSLTKTEIGDVLLLLNYQAS